MPPSSSPQALAIDALRTPLGAYLRLLWNVTPPLLHPPPDGDDAAATSPFLSRMGLHLPMRPAELESAGAARWYRAAAAHAAAHIVFSRSVFVREGTAPITQALLGLLEDARAEALACRELPGLRRLWAPWHTVWPDDGDDFETLMQRLARALIDPAYDDPHPWVRKGRARFFLDGGGEVLAQARPQAMRQLASALGNDIGQMRMGFNLRTYRTAPSYRDDNRWLWHSDESQAGEARPAPAAVRMQARSPTPAEVAPPPAAPSWHHAEWDRRIGRLRQDWCTVSESLAAEGPAVPMPAVDVRLKAVLERSARLARVMRSREPEGDEIDIDELLRAWPARRQGAGGEVRFHRRMDRMPAASAALLLLDTSASSGHSATGGGLTGLARQQSAASALAMAMSAAGWQIAIQGFCSDGRHAVRHRRVLDFDEPWGPLAARRLQGLEAGFSTRLGAAMRHATRQLTQVAAGQRLLIVLTDGEPHDIDIHEPHYLVEDACHAARTARLVGVRSLCLLLDPEATQPARRMFGADGVAMLTDVVALPGALARLLGGRV